MAKSGLNVTDESRSITKTIFLLAWPVLLEQIFTTLVSYADTAMVGSLGAWATAAVTICNPIMYLLNGVVMALGVGVTALVARSVGAGDPDMVRKLMRHAILIIIFVAIPICTLHASLHNLIPVWMGAEEDILEPASQYTLILAIGRFFMLTSMILNSAFRGYGDTKTPLYTNTIMNVVNVCFNFLLIYPTRELTVFGFTFTMWGAGLEVVGAALATAIGMAVAGIITLIIAFTRKNEYRISITDSFRPDWVVTKQLFKISLPAMLERFFMSSSGIFITSSIATLGTANIAANSLSLAAESLSFMPAFSFQTAATTLVGQSLGAGKPDLAERFVKKCMQIGIVIMIFTGAFLFICAAPIISIFTPDQEVIALAAKSLQVVSFLQPIQVAGWIYAGALRGAGDTQFNFYITASTNWLIRTLWSVICVRVFGLGLIAVQVCTLAEGTARTLLLRWRYKTGKWKTIIKD